MTVPKHLNEAVDRLNQVSRRIDRLRERPHTVETLEKWLAALTDYVKALQDIQAFDNESVHEKLHELAGIVRLKRFSSSTKRGSRRPAEGD